jgi:hypothetical protein
MDLERRRGTLRFEPDNGVLVVGARTAVLERPEPTEVIGTYVELVVAQRAVTPVSHHDLRTRELAELAAVLDLPPAELDALIDRELDRLLGRTPASRRRWPILATAGAAVVALIAVLVTTIGSGSTPPATPAAPDVPTVDVVELQDGTTAIRTESAPVPASGDGVDIGTAVRYDRNP